jgi:hypothetical protein
MQLSLLSTEPERVAMVGSRKWPLHPFVRSRVAALPPNTLVVSGGARGPDKIAVAAARLRSDFPTPQVFPADWSPNGIFDPRAGFKRNKIVVAASDRVEAFWYMNSPGTRDTVRFALAEGKPVTVWYADPELTICYGAQEYWVREVLRDGVLRGYSVWERGSNGWRRVTRETQVPVLHVEDEHEGETIDR